MSISGGSTGRGPEGEQSWLGREGRDAASGHDQGRGWSSGFGSDGGSQQAGGGQETPRSALPEFGEPEFGRAAGQDGPGQGQREQSWASDFAGAGTQDSAESGRKRGLLQLLGLAAPLIVFLIVAFVVFGDGSFSIWFVLILMIPFVKRIGRVIKRMLDGR